ncbi:MAG: hypothetical protein ACI9JR_000146 [Gammaproteobacteria bacterium]|jgi:uncharacterized protein
MQEKLHRLYQIHKELAQRGYHHGVIALEELSRLTSMLHSDCSEVLVNFEISSGDYDSPTIKGHVETKLAIECQRCLKPVDFNVDLDFELLIDAADDVVKESGLDTLYSEEGAVDIFEVVEDELILGLPLVALHEGGSCNEYWHVSEDVAEEAERENPFLVLEKLKAPH